MLRRGAMAATGMILAVCAVACQSSATVPQRTPEAVLDHYLSTQAEHQDFSGTILVAQNGKVLLTKGYGWADERKRIANQPSTAFGIGSITKQFTAMAILLLQERGKLRVRDPLCLYISGCHKTWMAITLQNLLTHTSGIPDYGASLSRSQRSPSESLLEYLERQPLDFPPGSQFGYSNSGYAIL